MQTVQQNNFVVKHDQHVDISQLPEDDSGGAISHLSIFNLMDRSMRYEVQCTSPKLFRVSPTKGLIEPKHQVDLPVQLRQATSAADLAKQHAFQVVASTETGEKIGAKQVSFKLIRSILKNKAQATAVAPAEENAAAAAKMTSSQEQVMSQMINSLEDISALAGDEPASESAEEEDAEPQAELVQPQGAPLKPSQAPLPVPTATDIILSGVKSLPRVLQQQMPVIFGLVIALIMGLTSDSNGEAFWEKLKLAFACYLVGLAAMFVQLKYHQEQQNKQLRQLQQGPAAVVPLSPLGVQVPRVSSAASLKSVPFAVPQGGGRKLPVQRRTPAGAAQTLSSSQTSDLNSSMSSSVLSSSLHSDR